MKKLLLILMTCFVVTIDAASAQQRAVDFKHAAAKAKTTGTDCYLRCKESYELYYRLWFVLCNPAHVMKSQKDLGYHASENTYYMHYIQQLIFLMGTYFDNAVASFSGDPQSKTLEVDLYHHLLATHQNQFRSLFNMLKNSVAHHFNLNAQETPFTDDAQQHFELAVANILHFLIDLHVQSNFDACFQKFLKHERNAQVDAKQRKQFDRINRHWQDFKRSLFVDEFLKANQISTFNAQVDDTFKVIYWQGPEGFLQNNKQLVASFLEDHLPNLSNDILERIYQDRNLTIAQQIDFYNFAQSIKKFDITKYNQIVAMVQEKLALYAKLYSILEPQEDIENIIEHNLQQLVIIVTQFESYALKQLRQENTNSMWRSLSFDFSNQITIQQYHCPLLDRVIRSCNAAANQWFPFLRNSDPVIEIFKDVREFMVKHQNFYPTLGNIKQLRTFTLISYGIYAVLAIGLAVTVWKQFINK